LYEVFKTGHYPPLVPLKKPLWRAVPRGLNLHPNDIVNFPPGGEENEGNRFSGLTVLGNPGHNAGYYGESLATWAEVRHYASKPIGPNPAFAFVGKDVLVVRCTEPSVRFLDLRASQEPSLRFWGEVSRRLEVAQLLATMGYPNFFASLQDPVDQSVPRAVAQALYEATKDERDVVGLVADTARKARLSSEEHGLGSGSLGVIALFDKSGWKPKEILKPSAYFWPAPEQDDPTGRFKVNSLMTGDEGWNVLSQLAGKKLGNRTWPYPAVS
jgi:hypothetical protein